MTTYTNVKFKSDINQCLPSCEKNIVKPTKHLFQTLALWNKRIVERKQLSKVDERLLRDMGISKLEAATESAKPFWRN